MLNDSFQRKMFWGGINAATLWVLHQPIVRIFWRNCKFVVRSIYYSLLEFLEDFAPSTLSPELPVIRNLRSWKNVVWLECQRQGQLVCDSKNYRIYSRSTSCFYFVYFLVWMQGVPLEQLYIQACKAHFYIMPWIMKMLKPGLNINVFESMFVWLVF